MTINWENIRYLFQIPFGWFKAISDKVFNAYGTNFIIVKDGDDGGMQIDVDEDMFGQMVSANVDLSGVVRAISVDYPNEYYTPDANGVLSIGTLGNVRSVNSTAPDSTGNVKLSGLVQSVNGITPDATGNVVMPEGVLNIVSYGSTLTPDGHGNLYLPNFVKTVNNISPDNIGNVNISASGGTVESVNGIEPDANGNVDLGDIVYSVNSEYPDQNGNVQLDIEGTVQDAIDNGSINITNSVNNIVQDAIDQGTLDVGTVKTVDGHSPDQNGAVYFNLLSNHWMKTNIHGGISTTDEVPVCLSSNDNGYLFSTNGVLSFKDEQYVDLSTVQTVNGSKTWEDDSYFHGDIYVINTQAAGNGGKLYHNSAGQAGLLLNGASGAGSIIYMTTGNQTASIANAAGALAIEAPSMIMLNAPKNMAYLSASPDNLAIDEAIATVGYCKTNCLSAPAGETLVTTTLSCCTEVKWDGTWLTYKRKVLRFVNGLLVQEVNMSDATIDTPVAY